MKPPEDRVDPERLGQGPGRERRDQDNGHEVAGEATFIERRPPEDLVQGRAQEPPGRCAERADQADLQAELRTRETREGEGRDRAEQEPTDHVGDCGRCDGDGADAGAVEVELDQDPTEHGQRGDGEGRGHEQRIGQAIGLPGQRLPGQ